MSDYSDEDFEMSGSGTAGQFDYKAPAGVKPAAVGRPLNNASATAPKKSGVGDFQLEDDDDEDDGYAPGGQDPTSNGDEYEDDDFDEEEEEQFKQTAVEFAKKLTALRQSTQYEMAEGGEEPTGIKSNKGTNNNSRAQQEETKSRGAQGRSVGNRSNNGGISPDQRSFKGAAAVRNQQARANAAMNQEITEDSLKSPTMLKTTMDKNAGKTKNLRQNQSPSAYNDGNSMQGGAGPGERTNPFRFIEAALNEAKSKIEKMKNTPQILESLPDDEKKKKFLKAENKLLRENLKRMSDNVNVLIEKMNQESLKKRRPAGGGRAGGAGGAASNIGGGMSAQGDEIGNVTIDENGRPVQGGVGAGLVPGHLPQSMKGGPQSTAGHSVAGQSHNRRNQSPTGRGGGSLNRGGQSVAERELQNTDKAIVNLMKEHNKLKRRLEMIQQPDFLLNLKRDLKTTQEEIKQQEKLKRQLKVDQLRREKKLDNLIEQSEPDVLKQVQDTTQRLAYLTEKLAKLEEENKKAEELRNQQIDQLEELRNRLAKLNTIAEHYGVSVEKSKENMAEHKKLTEQLEHLNKQKRILTQAIDTQTRKQEALTAEKKRDLEQLQMRKGEILAKYNERVIELREKGLQIRDLIERAKTEADDGLQDILSKWQEANERILEKYPEGSQMSFAQLEEAARNSIEEQQEAANDAGAQKGGIRDKKGSVTRAQKGKAGKPAHRDDEMQVYLSEIRQNQEHLIHQLRKDSQAAQALVEQPVEESVNEQPEESKNGDSVSQSAASLKNTRKLVGSSKDQASVQASAADANDSAANELAALRAELEKEKAEKARLAQEVANQQAAAEVERKRKEAEAQEAEEKRVQEQLRKKREEEEKANQQEVEGGEQVNIPVQPVAAAAESEGRISGLGSVNSAIKPLLGSRPKMGGGAFGKPSHGSRSSQAQPVTASIEKEGPVLSQAANSRYQATQQSVESIPKAPEQPLQQPQQQPQPEPQIQEQPKPEPQPQPQAQLSPAPEEPASTKPLSFLERRALASKGTGASYQPSTISNSNIIRPMQNKPAEVGASGAAGASPRESMMYNPTARQSTVGNEIIRPNNNAGSGVGLSMQSYQPSAVGQVPQTLTSVAQPASNKDNEVNASSNAAPGRRRRPGDSPKEAESSSILPAERKPVADPFAGISFELKKPAAPVNVAGSMASQKPLTYEQKMQQEASKGSFLDMIGGGGSGVGASQAQAPSLGAASKPNFMQPAQSSISRPMMGSQINASITSAANNNVNASIASKPPAKTNMIANLDDLEDLE